MRLDANEIWRAHIVAGNESFELMQDLSAIGHYQKAILCTNQLLEINNNFRNYVAALIVSFHNLADVFVRLQEYQLAEFELVDVHEILLNQWHQSTEYSHEYDILQWGLSKTYLALASHVKAHNSKTIVMAPSVSNSSLGRALN